MKRKAVRLKANEVEEEKNTTPSADGAEEVKLPCAGKSIQNFNLSGIGENRTVLSDETDCSKSAKDNGECRKKASILSEMRPVESSGLPNIVEDLHKAALTSSGMLDKDNASLAVSMEQEYDRDRECTTIELGKSVQDKQTCHHDVKRKTTEGECLNAAVSSQLLQGQGEKGVCGSAMMESSRALSTTDAQFQTFKGSGMESKERTESDDEDEEDIDFNPFLLQTPSPDASSGLSSESEGLEDENEVTEGLCNETHKGLRSLKRGGNHHLEINKEETNDDMVESEEEEDDDNGDCADNSTFDSCGFRHSKQEGFEVKSTLQKYCFEAVVGLDSIPEEENTEATTFGETFGDFAALSNLSGLPRNNNLGMKTLLSENANEDEQVVDAICRRTRARYSLTDMSLDELELFLQESDEEDYFQNVDDEEEYRKFLAAVQGNWKEGSNMDNEGGNKQGEDEEDEDEEDDYDFEIELEEALESDYEEIPKEEISKRKHRRTVLGSRKTYMERPLGLARTPLRPLLPSIANKDAAGDANRLLNETIHNGKSAAYGFTPCQRGQLHCLMHEHVQLLVQVFCLTLLDPSRQQIAMDTQRLLLQLADAREKVLSWKRAVLPEVCCCPRIVHSSTSSKLWTFTRLDAFQPRPPNQSIMKQHLPQTEASCSTCPEGEVGCSTVEPQINALNGIAGTCSHVGGRTESSNQHNSSQTTTNVHSLLDISSLALVKTFLTDVAKAVEDFKRQHLQSGSDSKEYVRQPLFPVPRIQNYLVSPPGPFRRKKTMAGTLVEDTKLNGIALVPAEISATISRFTSLFNPDLFPYKPPPAALSKRLLFSEAEDELLAMGLMRYNTNWEKIQQQFLPSKTTHQIFIRQKNRSSAKAPENSIKAVRRLKSSPLTKEELSCIEEGLKIYRSDWLKIWEHCVPYRDPATLCRLWRGSSGLQKSYSASVEAKEKHRISEKLRRQKLKDQEGDNNEELNSEDESYGGASGAYFHEAFLTDWNPQQCIPSVSSVTTPVSETPCDLLGTALGSSMPTCQASAAMQNLPKSVLPNVSTTEANHRLANGPLCSISSFDTTTFRTSRRSSKHSRTTCKGMQTIKLAPGLPSLNLPPCVRVIPQAKFNNQFPLANNAPHVIVHNQSSVSQKANLMAPLPLPVPSPAYLTGSSHFPGGNTLSTSHAESLKKPVQAKMHPLLMQTTFETGTSSSITNKKSPLPSLQSIPRYRPFLPVLKGKYTVGSQQGLQTSSDCSAIGAAELHPFLREEAEHQAVSCNTVRRMVEPVSSLLRSSHPIAVHENPLLGGHMRWLSGTSDSVIRPEPRRAVQLQGIPRELSANKMDSPLKSSHVCGNKGDRKARAKKTLSSSNKLGLRKQRQEENPNRMISGEEDVIMEQEELSDSDEETEEIVQFEYEEIGDSDKESSDREQQSTDLHKGDEGIEFEEEEISSDDAD